jgi:hypothetical protein
MDAGVTETPLIVHGGTRESHEEILNTKNTKNTKRTPGKKPALIDF